MEDLKTKFNKNYHLIDTDSPSDDDEQFCDDDPGQNASFDNNTNLLPRKLLRYKNIELNFLNH